MNDVSLPKRRTYVPSIVNLCTHDPKQQINIKIKQVYLNKPCGSVA
jgi:hypothetical protein